MERTGVNPTVLCRRDIHLPPRVCTNPRVCGSYCTNHTQEVTQPPSTATSTSPYKSSDHQPQSRPDPHRADVMAQRTQLIHQVIHVLKKKFRLYLLRDRHGQAIECHSIKLLVHVAKHMELLMFRSAASTREYTHAATLVKRMKYFALLINANPSWRLRILLQSDLLVHTSTNRKEPVRSQELSLQKLFLFTPTRWKEAGLLSSNHTEEEEEKEASSSPDSKRRRMEQRGVIINSNDCCYRSIVAASLPRIKAKTSTFPPKRKSLEVFNGLFMGDHSPVLTRIFSFLPGREVVRHMSLNRLCLRTLPQAISHLRIGTSSLHRFLVALESHSVHGMVQLSSLQHLCVYSEPLATASTNTTERKRKRSSSASPTKSVRHPAPHTVIASSLTREATSPMGEVAITTLARVLSSPLGCPQLEKLCLAGTFVNSVARNGIYRLTEALKKGYCQRLEYLWLGTNALGDYGAMLLGELFLTDCCPKLGFLDLRSNYIGDSGMKYLCQALSIAAKSQSSHRLKQLCLGGNMIGSVAFAHLLRCFKDGSMKELVFLGLDDNVLTTECLEALARELVHGQRYVKLKEICIGGNTALQEKEIVQLFREVADSAEGTSWGLFARNR